MKVLASNCSPKTDEALQETQRPLDDVTAGTPRRA